MQQQQQQQRQRARPHSSNSGGCSGSGAQLLAHVSVQAGPRWVGRDTTPMWAAYGGKGQERGERGIKKKKKSHAAGSGGGSRERSQCRSVFGCPQGGSDGQTAMHHARSTRVALRTHRKRRNSTRHTRTHKRHRTRAPSAPKGD